MPEERIVIEIDRENLEALATVLVIGLETYQSPRRIMDVSRVFQEHGLSVVDHGLSILMGYPKISDFARMIQKGHKSPEYTAGLDRMYEVITRLRAIAADWLVTCIEQQLKS